MPGQVYIEENGLYQIDFSGALWATDEVHDLYNKNGSLLSDVDFIAETSEYLLLVEYKNSNIPNAANPNAFQPQASKSIEKVARKFYDSLHYLALKQKKKPIRYIYIVETPHADNVLRGLLRNTIQLKLPFAMQVGQLAELIDGFEVLSIDGWNNHEEYSQFPLSQVGQGEPT